MSGWEWPRNRKFMHKLVEDSKVSVLPHLCYSTEELVVFGLLAEQLRNDERSEVVEAFWATQAKCGGWMVESTSLRMG